MKKTTVIIFAILFMAIPLLSFGQKETSTNEKDNTECKISYTFINEYGYFLGGGVGFTGVFVNGISIKKQNVLGIGIGYEIDTHCEQNVPLFFNFRHYFPSKRAVKPLVNVGIGTRISFWESYASEWCGTRGDGYIDSDLFLMNAYPIQRVAFGLYSTIAAGFKVKTFSFTSGFFLKSWNDQFFGGVELKVGYTF